MYKKNSLSRLFAEDKRLLIVLAHPFVSIMWRKRDRDIILFAPFAVYKGWYLENEFHASLCIVLSLLSYPWVAAPIYLVSLFSASYLYVIVIFWLQVITYKLLCRAIMKFYCIKEFTGVYLNYVDQDEFRRYLRSLS